MSITKVRQELCPIVKNVDALPEGKVGITVDGNVTAYIVSAKRLAALEAPVRKASRRASLRGTVQIMGDLEEGSREASQQLEQMALQSWRQPG